MGIVGHVSSDVEAAEAQAMWDCLFAGSNDTDVKKSLNMFGINSSLWPYHLVLNDQNAYLFHANIFLLHTFWIGKFALLGLPHVWICYCDKHRSSTESLSQLRESAYNSIILQVLAHASLFTMHIKMVACRKAVLPW